MFMISGKNTLPFSPKFRPVLRNQKEESNSFLSTFREKIVQVSTRVLVPMLSDRVCVILGEWLQQLLFPHMQNRILRAPTLWGLL